MTKDEISGQFIALQTPEFKQDLSNFVNDWSKRDFSSMLFDESLRLTNIKIFKNLIQKYMSDVSKTMAYLNFNQRILIVHNDLHAKNLGIYDTSAGSHAAIADWGEA